MCSAAGLVEQHPSMFYFSLCLTFRNGNRIYVRLPQSLKADCEMSNTQTSSGFVSVVCVLQVYLFVCTSTRHVTQKPSPNMHKRQENSNQHVHPKLDPELPRFSGPNASQEFRLESPDTFSVLEWLAVSTPFKSCSSSRGALQNKHHVGAT